jgi:dTDP-4-dehydrorhamnose reductase
VLAMQEIRKVRPDAKLVQTDDLGQTHSTPLLKYQATYENHRRWLSFDLLCGRVTPEHPLWKHLLQSGLRKEELSFFWENPCPPDLLGINYYLTSERFLDEKIKDYPRHLAGGNGRHAYVDTEAIRIPEVKMEGIANLLKQAWERYHIPMVVTEVHLGCTREDHIRWFYHIWKEASHLPGQGVDLKAVTVWALLGSFDWDSLLVENRNYYEPGMLDLRSPQPRPTGLATVVSQINTEGYSAHPILEGKGWWQREDRWIRRTGFPNGICATAVANPEGRPLLITGASGTLGQAFARICTDRGIAFRLVGRAELDITNPDHIAEVFKEVNPWAVINTAGYVKVDLAETEAPRCFKENHFGAVQLAQACLDTGIGYLTFSSDLVFNGHKGNSYLESDKPEPVGVYGSSKAAAEKDVLALLPSALVIRTSAFFSPWDEYNFVIIALRKLMAGEAFEAPAHIRVSPTYVPDLVNACLDLLLDGAQGIWHLANPGDVSWAEFARLAALKAGLPEKQVETWYKRQRKNSSPMPGQNTALASEKGWLLPPLEHALERYVRDAAILHNISKIKEVELV